MISPDGISAKLKDKRVDRILRKKGVHPIEYPIFYSPINGCLLYLALVCVGIIPFTCYIFYYIGWAFYYYFWLASFIAIAFYLPIAYLNFSFVITKKSLYCINPNFPFNHFYKFDFLDIKRVVVYRDISNYIKVVTDKREYKFYCLFLERDAYDENITEYNIDDFVGYLSPKTLVIKLLDH